MKQWLNTVKSGMKSWSINITCLLAILLIAASTTAQTRKLLEQGNKLYSEKRYDEASNNYMRALQQDPNNVTGMFNLGTALYQSKKYDSSRAIMGAAANAIKDKNGKAAVNYNIGNTFMAQRKWEDAIAAYKNTLRNNPQDEDAKYNLSYAQQMLKQEKKNGGGKDNKQDKNKDDKNKKDKQDKNDKNKDNKDKDQKNQQQQQNGDGKDKQDQQPQSQPSKLTQQQADQLLNAVKQQEKMLQDKMKKEKGIPGKMEKDW